MNSNQRDSDFSIFKLFSVHTACIWGRYFGLLSMSCHNKDRSCFQAAFLGTLWLSDRMERFDMVDKVVDMVDKVVDMSALVDHDNELWADDADAGNRVGIHIEKDID